MFLKDLLNKYKKLPPKLRDRVLCIIDKHNQNIILGGVEFLFAKKKKVFLLPLVLLSHKERELRKRFYFELRCLHLM